ncbi:PA2169 family four-helix-bundle protein [Aquincola sp. S2]|uniref:PA2169 family four-helix-bundle protein n=1 Tax=Pseudaquabacterium terrae TaxID=2732868 RepID=A0ABX2EHV7_9BURK|nr:PA2169 family four-helix-bundle protein [Aquabacterium terrae]NRF68167.1 PA2169 family four-helix-bundle protein [Aquabacterium terrae]
MTTLTTTAQLALLNRLIATCKDGEHDYRFCAELAQAPVLRTLMQRRATECRDAAAELQHALRALGAVAAEDGTLGGTLHRAWIGLRRVFSLEHDYALIDECERDDAQALQHYRAALQRPLPEGVQPMVVAQYERTARGHAQARLLCDQLRHGD